MKTTYKIAEAARVVGVSPSTLRLWESQGIVDPQRTESGQRLYSEADIDRLRRTTRMRDEEGLNSAAIRSMLADGANETDVSGDDRAHANSPSGSSVGRKLRLLRHSLAKTLGQVGREVGISASSLSTFERTSQGISVKTLHDLAHYFGTTVSDLSGEQLKGSRALVRAGEWQTWPRTMPSVTIQMLADGRKQMDCHRFVLAPGASSEGAYRHEGEEFMHLLSGQLEIILDHKEIYDLRPGDSLYFESRRHHSWTNLSDGETILLWINTPPTF